MLNIIIYNILIYFTSPSDLSCNLIHYQFYYSNDIVCYKKSSRCKKKKKNV